MKNFPKLLKHSAGVAMLLEENKITVDFSTKVKEASVNKILKDLKLELQVETKKDKEEGLYVTSTNHCKFLQGQNNGKLGNGFVENIYKKYKKEVEWVGPVYRVKGTEGIGGLVTPLPHVLVIKPADNISEKEEKELLNKLKKVGLIEDRSKSEFLGPYRYFQLKDPAKENVYKLKTEIETEFEDVQEVSYENLPLSSDTTAVSNDTFFAQQWNLTQTNVAGPGRTAWDITRGRNTINIAILDTGCDLTHPDITYQGNGFNATTGTPNGSNTGNTRNDAHGTACAGVAAATINNARGIAGVAGGCQVIAVNRNNSSDVNTARAIRWAADNGADVISMSFGRYNAGEGRGPTGWNFALINPAITYAVNTRRCVLVAATGNENINTLNRYPARHPLVIAVGASDRIDNRKSPASPDGEGWGANWGVQNFGGVQTGVSVVAPGVQIPATDIVGTGGANGSGGTAGNYRLLFNGTSSATPQVAGLAALILSINSTLAPQQVRNIIELSAAKVGVTPYAINPNFPNGTWNQQMGHGRINVLGALDATKTTIKEKEKEFKEKEIKEIKEFKEIEKTNIFDKNPKEYIIEKNLIKEFKESPKEFKEKEVAYEGKPYEGGFDRPDIIQQSMKDVISRLESLEKTMSQGRHFIQNQERPEVGKDLSENED